MRSSAIFLPLLSSTLTIALPLDTPIPQHLRRGKTFAIVNVDGGSAPTSAGPPPPPVTVLQTITVDDPPAPPATQTIQQTVVVTDSTHSGDKTVVVTFVPPTPTSTSTPTPSSSTSQLRKSSSLSLSTRISGATSSTPLPPARVTTKVETNVQTITEAVSAQTTVYYDDGSWKTLYPVRSTDAAVPTPAVESPLNAPPTPTSEVDIGEETLDVDANAAPSAGSSVVELEQPSITPTPSPTPVDDIAAVNVDGEPVATPTPTPQAQIDTVDVDSESGDVANIAARSSSMPALPTLTPLPAPGFNGTRPLRR